MSVIIRRAVPHDFFSRYCVDCPYFSGVSSHGDKMVVECKYRPMKEIARRLDWLKGRIRKTKERLRKLRDRQRRALTRLDQAGMERQRKVIEDRELGIEDEIFRNKRWLAEWEAEAEGLKSEFDTAYKCPHSLALKRIGH